MSAVIPSSTCFFWPSVTPPFTGINPVTKTLHLFKKDEQVYSYKIYNPAYNFYLNKPIQMLDNPEQVNKLMTAHPDAVIISREIHLPELEGLHYTLLAKERDLFETATTVLFSGK